MDYSQWEDVSDGERLQFFSRQSSDIALICSFENHFGKHLTKFKEAAALNLMALLSKLLGTSFRLQGKCIFLY